MMKIIPYKTKNLYIHTHMFITVNKLKHMDNKVFCRIIITPSIEIIKDIYSIGIRFCFLIFHIEAFIHKTK